MENTKPTLRIEVDDGRIAIPIFNKLDQQIGTFMFNPTDFNIVTRYNEFVDKFDNVVAPLAEVDTTEIAEGESEENTDSRDKTLEALQEATNRLYEACDILFDGNYSAAFFGSVNPFSPIDGRFYCQNALESVGDFIAKQFDKETKKMNTRIDRYTHGYAARTGKHRNGRK